MTRTFSLWTLQGILAFLWLAWLPSDSGLSPARLALLGILLLITGFSAAFALAHSQHTLATRFLALRKFDPFLPFLCLFGLFAAPLTILTLNALAMHDTGYFYSALATRLTPIAAWVLLSALEYLLFNAIKTGKIKFIANRPVMVALAALIAVAALMLATRLGLTPLKDGSFGSPALPALEWQIILAFGLALIGPYIIQGASSFLNTKRQMFNAERLTFFMIYLSTLALWLATPIQAGWFATPPRAPNFEIYPFSDALIYAQYVQSALAGYGFMWPEVPTRPFYIVILTWLHALGGQDYTTIIVLQTLALAAFPAILYLLGNEIGGKPLGIGLAVLAALRDVAQNQAATFSVNYTYSKLYFSEIPAALLMTLSAWLAIRWMRRESTPAFMPLVIGGLAGLAALIRLQSAVVLVAFVIVAFLVMRGRRKAWISGTILMALGLTLAISPWLARNTRAAGGLVFDNPISQTMVFARRWGGSAGNELLPKLPGENDAQYSSRMTRFALDAFQREPGRILLGAANHFFNNQYALLLTFPLRDKLTSPAELVQPAHAFWQSDARFDGKNLPILAIYAVLAAIGLGAAWRQAGWVGLLPLMLASLYNAWTALFLSSGDRFMLPVDWAGTLYLLLGLLTLIGALAGRDVAPPPQPDTARDAIPRHAGRGLILTAACILLIGTSLPLTEFAFPKAEPLNAPGLAPQAGEVIRSGRAIYPRYYAAGEGEPGTAKAGYEISNEARLVFFLVGEEPGLVILPLADAPQFFPHTAEVVVIGALQENNLHARVILLQKDDQTAQYP
ncbi:MAG: hypothetical protein CVU44_03005 [Chloroflexi bacterium HGW-Chloroflexi-6]|nr:MAG: hypothetical protein CVU44_03005 [Chloroflexi bacterium HGW-Chloroflexi-6]